MAMNAIYFGLIGNFSTRLCFWAAFTADLLFLSSFCSSLTSSSYLLAIRELGLVLAMIFSASAISHSFFFSNLISYFFSSFSFSTLFLWSSINFLVCSWTLLPSHRYHPETHLRNASLSSGNNVNGCYLGSNRLTFSALGSQFDRWAKARLPF